MRSIWKLSFNYTFPSPLTIGSGHPAGDWQHRCFKPGALSCFNIDLTSGRTFRLKLWWKSLPNKPSDTGGNFLKVWWRDEASRGHGRDKLGRAKWWERGKVELDSPANYLPYYSSSFLLMLWLNSYHKGRWGPEFTGLFLSCLPIGTFLKMKKIKKWFLD